MEVTLFFWLLECREALMNVKGKNKFFTDRRKHFFIPPAMTVWTGPPHRVFEVKDVEVIQQLDAPPESPLIC